MQRSILSPNQPSKASKASHTSNEASALPPALVIADEKQYLYYRKSPLIDLGIRPGDPLNPFSLSDVALREGREIMDERDEALFGVPYAGLATPVTHPTFGKIAVTLIFPSITLHVGYSDHQPPFAHTASSDHLAVWDGRAFRLSPLSTVLYLTTEGRKTKVVTERFTGYHRQNLSTLLQTHLDPRQFIRVHRKIVVNIAHILALHPYPNGTLLVEMSDGSRLQSSRQYAHILRTQFDF